MKRRGLRQAPSPPPPRDSEAVRGGRARPGCRGESSASQAERRPEAAPAAAPAAAAALASPTAGTRSRGHGPEPGPLPLRPFPFPAAGSAGRPPAPHGAAPAGLEIPALGRRGSTLPWRVSPAGRKVPNVPADAGGAAASLLPQRSSLSEREGGGAGRSGRLAGAPGADGHAQPRGALLPPAAATRRRSPASGRKNRPRRPAALPRPAGGTESGEAPPAAHPPG